MVARCERAWNADIGMWTSYKATGPCAGITKSCICIPQGILQGLDGLLSIVKVSERTMAPRSAGCIADKEPFFFPIGVLKALTINAV